MDIVSFLIPNMSNNQGKVKENLVESIKITNNKYNEYSKIKENVYKFNSVDISIDVNDNINILYNSGSELRKIGNYEKALKIFQLCEKKIDETVNLNMVYEIYVNLALIHTSLNSSYETILTYYEKAMKIFKDRSEPYFYLALYCNHHKNFTKTYELLTYSITNLTYENVKSKYLNVQYNAYDKFLYDELSVACYWLGKYEESIELINKIINDKDFENIKERLNKNLKFAKEKLNNK